MSDPQSLWATRYELRRAFVAIRSLPQTEPTIRCVLDELDRLAVEITVELDAAELPLEVGP